MNLTRRVATLALGLAAPVALTVGTAAPAGAQSTPSTSQASARIDSPPPDGYTGDELGVTGIYEVAEGWSITSLQLVLNPVEGSGACDAPPAPPQVVYPSSDTSASEPQPPDPTDPVDHTTAEMTLTATPPCNGRYTAVVRLTADVEATSDGNDIDDPPGTIDDDETTEHAVPEELLVSLRPPDPAAVAAEAAGRAVTIAWQAPAAAPPDLSGYYVDRALGDAAFTRVAVIDDPATLEQADTLPVGYTGSVRYRVRSTRPDGDGDAVVASAGGPASIGEVQITPPTTTSTSTAGGGTTTTGRQPSRGLPPIARRPAPSRPQVQSTVPPTTVDEGYEEFLDYSDVEPGDEEAVAPEDAGAFLDFGPTSGEGILVPFAIAECLAVWAFHLRLLARRAEQL